MYSLKIKDLPLEERPREKLIKYGSKNLTNSELLAIILGNGSKKQNVLHLSRDLLEKSNIKKLARKRISYLKKTFGIGEVKACKIVACFELGRRLSSFKECKNQTINQAKDLVKVIQAEMNNLKKEHLKCVFLNSRKRMIKEETIFIGTLDSSVIHPREIFKAAIEESAAAIIIIHNHPSGDIMPSDEDIIITEQIVETGKIIGIEVLDHIIIADGKYFSFKEMGYF